MADPEVKASILNSTKKALGLDPDYDVFDIEITMHINSTFSTLHQLGVGPIEGYFVDDATNVWTEFTEDNPLINSVKTYMFLAVKLLFDPPQTSYAIAAVKEILKEYEWRLTTQQEGVRHPWVAPIIEEPQTTF